MTFDTNGSVSGRDHSAKEITSDGEISPIKYHPG